MRRAAAAAVAASLLGAACAGSGTATSPSAASAPFCDSARTIVGSLRGNVLTDPRGAKRVADAITGLTPPAAIAGEWPAFVAYVKKVSAIDPRAPDAAAQALAALGDSAKQVSAVGAYLVDTCQVDVAASDLSELS